MHLDIVRRLFRFFIEHPRQDQDQTRDQHDRAYQAPALAAVMREFGDVAPAVSVMIVDGLASPELLMEIDIQAVLSE